MTKDKPIVETGRDVSIQTKHFNTIIAPFKKTFQIQTTEDVGNYYMAMSLENIDELIEFLGVVKKSAQTKDKN